MPTKLNTTKLQVSGYKWLIRRLEQAFVTGDVRMITNYLTYHKNALFAAGMAITGVAAAIAFILGMIRPAPSKGSSEIMTTQSGGMYVSFEGRLHPVTNLASARLITGKAANSVVVSNSLIAKFPRGPLMGIPQAPNNLDERLDSTALWAVCDWRDSTAELSLVAGSGVRTTLIAGTDQLSGGTSLGSERAMLARSDADPAVLWLIFGNHKAQVGAKDFATWSALNLTPAKVNGAATLSAGLMNSIDSYPILSTPPIQDRGKVSRVLRNALVGDVLVTSGASGKQAFYLALDDGVQLINPVLAQMFINTGSGQVQVPDPQAVLSLPQLSTVDTDRFPSQVPDIINPATVCFTWSKGINDLTASTNILTGTSLPIRPESADLITQLLPPKGTVVQANASLMTPGKGWYVRVTGNDPSSLAAEQLDYIDDSGTRYAIAPGNTNNSQGINYDNTVRALGLNIRAPLPIPWAVAQLYAQGSTLDPADARTMHGSMPSDPNQVAIPPKKN